MRIFKTLAIVILSFLLAQTGSAQIQSRLATQCATAHVDVPIVLSNLENISEFHLKLLFDNSLLAYDTTLYHNESFSINNNDSYKIKTHVVGDTLMLDWSAYYGVNLDEGLLLSIRFSETGNGQASFQWIEDDCEFKNINGLNIDASYAVDAPLAVPNNTAVSIDFNQFTIGCRDDSETGGCKAQVEVSITGGQEPYIYQWFDKLHQTDAIAIGLCQDPVAVLIKDNAGCYYAADFAPVVHAAAKYNVLATPEEVYITKPNAQFSVELEEGQIETYAWDFGDKSTSSLENPSHAYAKVGAYNVSLKTKNIEGCDTTVILSNYQVKELNFCIPNVFTPNGDNINDEWVFKIMGEGGEESEGETSFRSSAPERTGLVADTKQCSGKDLIMRDYFKTCRLVVVNRNGSEVFECTNCQENWDGGGAPDGVYFYVFEWEGEYTKGKETGNVTIIGSGNK